ncbi:hypothetical protein [Endozoicomonas sp.]|uniref:hypothetical protein n=1 Tax=Endozoicomonas sp. TaxID=1892382 RepID=UPI003AF48E5E
MNSLRKVCSLFLLLAVMVFQVHATDFPDHLKDASKLTAKVYKKVKPNVLLCILPHNAESGVSGDVIGKVIPGNRARTYLCEYTLPTNDILTVPFTTPDFQWLDVNHGQLASWLTSFASVEKSDNGKPYFVLRHHEHNPEHAPAICVQTTAQKGFEFGYETMSDDGQKSCSNFVGATYPSPFFNATEAVTDGCTGETFSPDCHQCNGDGCSPFRCSAFTTWDQCPKGSHQCDYEVCASHFCTNKPICEWDK